MTAENRRNQEEPVENRHNPEAPAETRRNQESPEENRRNQEEPEENRLVLQRKIVPAPRQSKLLVFFYNYRIYFIYKIYTSSRINVSEY